MNKWCKIYNKDFVKAAIAAMHGPHEWSDVGMRPDRFGGAQMLNRTFIIRLHILYDSLVLTQDTGYWNDTKFAKRW